MTRGPDEERPRRTGDATDEPEDGTAARALPLGEPVEDSRTTAGEESADVGREVRRRSLERP